MASLILMNNEPDLLKPLFILSRFQDDYFAYRRHTVYCAMEVVLTSLEGKLSRFKTISERLKNHIDAYRSLLDDDCKLDVEIKGINEKSDKISFELTSLFSEISRQASELSAKQMQDIWRLRDRLITLLVISLGIGLIILLFITSIVANKMVRPLKEIFTVVKQVKSGNIDARFTWRGKDDIAQLGFAFNDMLGSLKKSQQEHRDRSEELEESRKELEAKVGELERFNKFAINRELKMAELKKKIKELDARLGSK
jgi:methyl-accepting chemotaxis protein